MLLLLALSPGGATAAASMRQSFLVAAAASPAGFDLRASPGGRVLRHLGSLNAFGTRQVLGVVVERGAWLGVTTEAVPNGTLGWVRRSAALRVMRIRTSVHVSLSRRRLDVVVGSRVVASFHVGVGSPASPTPTGRFAIGEKLDGSRYGAAFGCCILGLSAHQTRPPPGWDPQREWLVAFHGGSVGGATSAGCIHLADGPLRYLMRRVPVGAPVFITR